MTNSTNKFITSMLGLLFLGSTQATEVKETKVVNLKNKGVSTTLLLTWQKVIVPSSTGGGIIVKKNNARFK